MTPVLSMASARMGAAAGAVGRVLVADDHPDCAESLALLLDMRGFETATVEDGADVLPVIDRFNPDVVILDLVMPGCDGEAIAQELLNRPPQRRPRVIVATGLADEPRRTRLAQLGIDAYLLKPADPAVLLSCIDRACRANTRANRP